jgi:hypothetical protein
MPAPLTNAPGPTNNPEALVQRHRLSRTARAVAAVACILLTLAAPAGAMPADNGPPPSTTSQRSAAPTVVRETVLRPDDGPGALALVVIGVGAAAALLGAGYLGARLAIRNSRLRAG